MTMHGVHLQCIDQQRSPCLIAGDPGRCSMALSDRTTVHIRDRNGPWAIKEVLNKIHASEQAYTTINQLIPFKYFTSDIEDKLNAILVQIELYSKIKPVLRIRQYLRFASLRRFSEYIILNCTTVMIINKAISFYGATIILEKLYHFRPIIQTLFQISESQWRLKRINTATYSSYCKINNRSIWT